MRRLSTLFAVLTLTALGAAQSTPPAGKSITFTTSPTCDAPGPGARILCLGDDLSFTVSVNGSPLAAPSNLSTGQVTPTFKIGTVATLAPGTPATVTLTGTFPNFTFNFGIPQGATGAASTVAGPAGPPGPLWTSCPIAAIGTSGLTVSGCK